MKHTVQWTWRIMALVLIVSMVLAGCGGRGGDTTPTPGAAGQAGTEATATTGAEEEPTTAPTEAAEASPTAAAEGEATAEATAAAEGEATAEATATGEAGAEGEATPAAATEGEGAGAAAGSQPTLNADASGRVELWHFWASPVRRQAVRRVIAICKQQLPNIEVVDTVKPFGDIWTANLAAVAAGSGMPDVIVSDRPTLPKDAAEGVYMNLQELATRDNVTREQFYDWAWDQTLYEGNTYGIPFETDVRVLFWNKNLFEQAGLDPEKPPATWDELQAYADKLDKVENGQIQRVGFFPLWNTGADIWAYTNGLSLISEEGQPQINDPKMVEVVDWIKGWVDRYGGWQALQNFRNQYGAPPNDLFMSGAAAMITDIYGYNSQLNFYRPQIKLDNGETVRMEWGVAPLPYNAEPANWSGGFSLSIPQGAANTEAAWEFIKCTTGAEGQSSWARDTQAQPTNLQAANDPVLLADPTWQVATDSLKTSTGGTFLQAYPNWSEQLSQRWEQIWLGEKTPQAALDEAQQAVQAAIQ